jgi:hypothetical protein
MSSTLITGVDAYGLDRTPKSSDFFDEGVLVFRDVILPEQGHALTAAAEPVMKAWIEHDPQTGRAPNPKQNGYITHFLEHPTLLETDGFRATLDDYLNDPDVVRIIKEILGPSAYLKEVTFRFNPSGQNRNGNWHRDTQSITGTDSDEQAMIEKYARNPPYVVAEYTLTISTETDLCPGSHLRWDDEDEHDIRLVDHGRRGEKFVPLTAIRPYLSSGDVMIYHPFIIHRTRRAADRKQRLILGVWTTPEREAEFGGVLPVVG